MRRRYSGRPSTIIHALLILVPLTLLHYHGAHVNRESTLSRAAVYLTLPGQKTMGALARSGGELANDYLVILGVDFDLRRRYSKLNKEHEKLQLLMNDVKRRLEVQQRRATMCGFTFADGSRKLVPARVISRSTGPVNQGLRIQIEAPSGITIPKDPSVIAYPAGLVGIVIRSTGNTADVQLINDKGSTIPAQISGTNIPGTTYGTGTRAKNSLKFIVTADHDPIKKGSTLVTSGHGNRYSKGIIIGEVTSERGRQAAAGVKVEYTVSPYIRFWQLEEVFLVLETLVEED